MSNDTFKLRPENLPQSRGELLATLFSLELKKWVNLEKFILSLYDHIERVESLYIEAMARYDTLLSAGTGTKPTDPGVDLIKYTVGSTDGWTVMRPGETPAEAVGRTGCLTLKEAVDLIAVELGAEPSSKPQTPHTPYKPHTPRVLYNQGARAMLDESRLQVDQLRHENERLRYELNKARNPVRR